MTGMGAAAAVCEALPSLLRPRPSSFSSLSPLFTPSSSAALVGSGSSRRSSSSVVAGFYRRSFPTRVGDELPATPRLFTWKPRPSRGASVRSGFRALASMSSESAANNPGLHETPDDATKGYFLQQTMYRIKDPKVSLDFYTRILGMSLLKRLDFPEAKFSLYFIGFEDTAKAPTDSSERTAWTFGKKATLELTHNWGTESDENFKGHHNGNSDPKGYGHIGVTVDDTHKACARFEKLGVKFVKKPDEGKMKGIAFIQDPDGYWIELFDIQSIKSVG